MNGAEVGPHRLRLITWNIARRRSQLVEQATVLARRAPDVVALQEITRHTLPLWREAFVLMGLEHVRSSLTTAPARMSAARRSTGVLLASRTELRDVEDPVSVPWPESALCAAAETNCGPVEIFSLHVPNAANGSIKPQTLKAIRDDLAVAGPGARVVCGDLNTPRRELPTGEVISFARDRSRRLRRDRGPAWDAAELGVVPGLRDLGYRDVYRALHGYERDEPSWTWQRIAGHSGGWRIDHIFASSQLQPISCLYHHAWRDDGLSDHSALEADFA
ncbi:MAG: endonuclease/exonuclease/phosphatase family protein [Solirubrobacterales bacterium]|nr:endonuclease/exonuclease/phosphatase family protein [Solirubrobacterales bacterium]